MDGEHHPAAVREALDGLDRARGVEGVVFCGGEEKVGRAVLSEPERHYGRRVESGEDAATLLRRMAGGTGAVAVVDLADEPIVGPARKLRLAALALDRGLDYEAPGLRLLAPSYERVPFAGPLLAVIGTGKRTGKTAVAGHWASLLRAQGRRPTIVAMGRGGPREPTLAEAGTGLGDLLAVARAGAHAASDFLEDAVLAGVPAVGARRVGGGLAGEPHESNVADAVRLAASTAPGVLILEGSGSCVPPVEVDRTVCVVGDRAGALEGLGLYRLLRADLAVVAAEAGSAVASEVAETVAGPVIRFDLRPEPAGPLPEGARVALFTTGAPRCEGVEPVVASVNLARREALEADLDRAAAERCDVYLTELKAAAIDTVALRAEAHGAEVVFVRNRPVGLDADLDEALAALVPDG